MKKLNIYKRKDGRFEGRIYIGTKDKVKRQYKSFYGHSKTEVEEKYECFKSTTVEHMNSDVNMTFECIAKEWLCVIHTRIKESTYANYMMKLNKHILPVFGNYSCAEIKSRHISAFVDVKQKDGLSSRYISDIIIIIKAVFKYAYREYNIRISAADISIPKSAKAEVRLLSDSERCTLEKYIAARPDKTALGIAISLYTGLRIGELCALQWGDIDLDKRILTVRKTIQRIQSSGGNKRTKLTITEPKSDKSKREIPIPSILIDLIKSHMSASDDYVLTGKTRPIEPRTLQYRFAGILNNADLPSVHFHSLRHAFATRAVSLGFDIKTLSELLGHSSIELTLNRYVHSSFEKKREYMELMKWS